MFEPAGFEWQDQLEAERHAAAVDALNRCAAAGAKEDDLLTLARECGVNPKLIQITHPKGT